VAQGLLKVSISELDNTHDNVRELAAYILARIELGKAYADILLDRTLRSVRLSRRDSALLSELTYGTLRWRGRIDGQLRALMRRPLESAHPFIRNLLRMALYQTDFLDRIPDYAAVNAAVDLAKIHRGEHAGRFVNAVLRRHLREKENSLSIKPAPESAGLSDISVYWSHPQWLVQQWSDYLGFGELPALLQANNEEPALVLRVNLLRTTKENLLELLHREGVQASPTSWSPQGISISSSPPVDQLPGFQEGLFQVQGEASQLVGYLVAPHAGERILDACAAPGGKATHLAELTGNLGEIVGTDISKAGLEKLAENARRLGLDSIRTLVADARKGSSGLGNLYDRILIDAPCSGLGTLRAHPEIKWNRTQTDIQRLSRLQRAILARCADQLKPGGVLVYSTCTLTAAENELVVQHFLDNCGKFVLEDAAIYLPAAAKKMVRNGYFMAWPHRHGTDGFFAARLKKVAA
jgi:16S rRNA (cytosine967-C5)-methyltransferase